MASSRREFLRSSGALLGGALVMGPARKVSANEAAANDLGRRVEGHYFRRGTFASGAGADPITRPQANGVLPVLQGATSATQTQFRILGSANKFYHYAIVDVKTGTRRIVAPIGRVGVARSGHLIDHVWVDGLEPNHNYRLEISDSGSAAVLDRRLFATGLPPGSSGAPLRVAVISCQNDRYVNEQADMWDAVAWSTPEMLLFNGDSCYVDQRADGTMEGMWSRHVETRLMLDVFRWDRLVPVYTTWDDHDTAENDSDSSNPRLAVARKYFDWMFGSLAVDGMAIAPSGVTSLDRNGMRFLLTDCRSAKTGSQIYSAADESWLHQQVLTAPGPVWIAGGIQFFGGYLSVSEAVEKTAPKQLSALMQIGRQAPSPLMLLSGDVHFSEVMELEEDLMGYTSVELTSSALHSSTFPGIQYRSYNPRRIDSTWRNNYLAIEMHALSSRAVEFEVSCIGAAKREYFRYQGSVKK